MFFSPELLTKKGIFALAWLAGTCTASKTKFSRILSNKHHSNIDIVELCENILNPHAPLSLRLRGILLLGVTVLYKEYVLELEKDVIKVWNSLQSSSIVDSLGRTCDIISLDSFFSSRLSEKAFRINLDEESERLNKITLPLHIPVRDSAILDEEMDIYFDENTNEEDDITLRYVDHDDIDLFQDNISNFITIPNEENYQDYDFESGRFRSDASLGNFSEGDMSGSRKSSQPFDIVINDMKNELNDDVDFLSIQKEIDSYIPTELDLLQNDDSESIDIDGFAIDDAMMDLKDDDMPIEGENEIELNSEDNASQSLTEEKKHLKKFNTVNDKEIELSNKKIQSNIDNVDRLFDSNRLEVLLSSEKLNAHKSSVRMKYELNNLFEQTLFNLPPKNGSIESISLHLQLDKIKNELKLTSNRGLDEYSVSDLDINSLSEFKASDNLDSLSSAKDSIRDDLISMDFNDGISEGGWESFQRDSDHSPLSQSLINSINEHMVPPERPKPERSRSYGRDSESDVFREARQSHKLLKFLENKAKVTTPITKIKRNTLSYHDSSSVSSSLSRNMDIDENMDESMKDEFIQNNNVKSNEKWLNFDDLLTGSLKNTAARTFFQILVLSSSGHINVLQERPYDIIYVSIN